MKLTPSQREALAMHANGMSLQSIADELGVLHMSIVYRIASARRRIGARTTAHCLTLALYNGDLKMLPDGTVEVVNVDRRKYHYPWNLWMDGNTWIITQDIDYDISSERMTDRIYQKARRLDRKVTTRVLKNEEGVEFVRFTFSP